jgi:serine/threonine-protein kinase
MEYIQGQTFAHVLKDARVDRGEKLRMLEEVARAVAFAHSRGVIHRDLKPGNVLIDNRDHVFLTDFGLARSESFATRLTRSETIMGTPQYMAPEQVEGRVKEIDKRTDVYALGVILFETLVGVLPFRADTPARLYHSIVNEDPPRPSRVGRSIERDLEVICLKALEKDPAYRYENAEEFAEDLGRWRRGEPIQARPPSIVYRLRKGLARRKGIVRVSLVAAFLVAGLAVYFIPRLSRETEKTTEARRQAAVSHARTIEQLQKRTDATLAAALALRRAGRLGEMVKFWRDSEEACREVIQEVPDRPEPYYELGRMYRAFMEDDHALRLQESALERDPEFAPALYERIVLNARRYRARIRVLVASAWLEEGRRLLDRGEGRIRAVGEIPLPSRSGLASKDPEAKKIRALLESDVRELEGSTVIGPGKLATVRGLLAWIEGRREQARIAFSEAIGNSIQLEEAYQALATLELEENRFEESVRWWSEGIKADAGYLPHLDGRGETWLQWGIHLASGGGDPSSRFEQAVEDYRRAIRNDPDRMQGWLGRGLSRMTWAGFLETRGEDPTALYQMAVGDFTEAGRRKGHPASVWLSRGLARLNWGGARQGKGLDPGELYGGAIHDFNRALENDADRDGTWYARGVARLNWGVYKEEKNEDPVPLYQAAIEDFDEALARNPGKAVTWVHRALAFRNRASHEETMGRDPDSHYERALADYGKAFRLDSKRIGIRQSMGEIRSSRGDRLEARGKDPTGEYRKAVSDFSEVLKRRPEQEGTWMVRGHVLLNLGAWQHDHGENPTGAYEAAVSDFEKVLAKNPRWIGAWLDCGAALVNLAGYLQTRGGDPVARYEGAAGKFDRAVDLDPKSARARWFRAEANLNWAVYKIGKGATAEEKLRQALEDFEEAIRLRPGMAPRLEPSLEKCREYLRRN